MDTTLNKDEKKALASFLIIYTLSALVLIFIIAFLYYKKEVVIITDICSVEMRNQAMMVEKELMKASMEHKKYKFNPSAYKMRVGLFDEHGKPVYSNLESKQVLLSKKAYKNYEHEYHIARLNKPLFGISYIVIEGNQIARQKTKLLVLIGSVIFVSLLFISIIGYFLSRLLIAPIKKRVEKLNCFIKDSAHDINTPVSALMMSVSSLKGKNQLSPKTLHHISISAKLISQIYNSLSFIAFNNEDKVLNERFDLAVLVKESIKFFDEIAASKGNTIEFTLEPTMVFMDRSRIQKAINNLISNAIKYSYPNTKIQIKLKDRVFSITDEGIGIADEDKEIIFTRYERKNKDNGGFGIGLDIVKSVCNQYNIKIKVKSQVSKGTTFFLVFP